MMVITPKRDGAVLMQILKLLLKQFPCASVGGKKFDITRSRLQFLIIIVC
jgi:hypothetical protein